MYLINSSLQNSEFLTLVGFLPKKIDHIHHISIAIPYVIGATVNPK
jgi:hypothetical protein